MIRLASLLALLVVAACCKGGGATTTPTPPPPADPAPPTEPPKDPSAACQKDRPCDNAPPPACIDSPRPKTVDDVFASADRLNGATVSIAAPLHPGPMRCTRMACSEARPCCNQCGSGLVLATTDPNQASSPRVDLTGEGLACTGDDSGVCCPVPTAGRAVIATGTLRVQGDATSGFSYVLENATLCSP